MPPRRPKPPSSFAAQAFALAWGAWVELGVSGWARTHEDWAVDPEPLILFTAWLGDADPRLRDEATDWCIRNWRFVSKVRLRNLLRQQPLGVRETFGEFAATVGIHAGIMWPGATTERRYTVTGRSTLPPLDRPSLAWLRLRAIFGLGARTEILRYFLSGFGKGASVARLAAVGGYVKRVVAEECDTLERAGVLSVRRIGNRFFYSLAHPAQLEAFVGALPLVRPHWTAALNVTRGFVELEEAAETGPHRTLPVKARRMVRLLEDDFDDLDIETRFEDVSGEDLWPAVRQLGMTHVGAWATGRWVEGTRHTTPAGVVTRVVRR